MSKYPWMNAYTGEVNETLWKAIKAAMSNFIHYPKCRTLKVFKIVKAED